MAIGGHMSRRMMEHHSHIRLAAKRKALDGLDRMREERRQAPDGDATAPAPETTVKCVGGGARHNSRHTQAGRDPAVPLNC